MTELALASIAYNAPRALEEQIRLLGKYLLDDFVLVVVDQSGDGDASDQIRRICSSRRSPGFEYGKLVYTRDTNPSTKRLHHEALNFAARELLSDSGLVMPWDGARYVGFLDHDVYPTKPTSLIPLIEEAGFLGIGQRHAPTGYLYLWPGFCFFSREWLNGRPLDFTGIRAENPADNGDTGSGLWPLFAEEDWSKLYSLDHGYRAIREPDSVGLQSWGVELFGDWLHVTNASGWMTVPEREDRERRVYDMLAAL